MIKVKLLVTAERQITAFEVTGHANYADYGQDIVCAGVSAIVQTTVMGLQYFLESPLKLSITEGYLSCVLPEFMDSKEKERASILLKAMELGLETMLRSYSKNLQIVWEYL